MITYELQHDNVMNLKIDSFIQCFRLSGYRSAYREWTIDLRSGVAPLTSLIPVLYLYEEMRL